MFHSIVIFGDSITQGAFDAESGGWVSRLAAFVYGKEKADRTGDTTIVFNLGISGESSVRMKERFQTELSHRVEYTDKVTVVIDMGGNDAGVEIATGKNHVEIADYIANMRHCIRHAKEKGYGVVCLGLGSYDESRTDPILWDKENAARNSEAARYDDALKVLAGEEEALYIPTRDLFATRPELLLDGDHPNSEGHKLIFERVKEYLEKASIL